MITITVKGEMLLVFRALHQPLSRGSFCLLIVRFWYSGREGEDEGAGSLVLGSEGPNLDFHTWGVFWLTRLL